MSIYFPDIRRVIGSVCDGNNSACHNARERSCLNIGYACSTAGHVITCCSAQNLKENIGNGLLI